MGSHSVIFTCAFTFTGPLGGPLNKLTFTTSSDRSVDAKSIEVAGGEVLSDDLLQAFSKLDQRNIEGFLKHSKSYLLSSADESQSLRVNERSNNTQDDLSAESAPHGSDDGNGYGNVSELHVYVAMALNGINFVHENFSP